MNRNFILFIFFILNSVCFAQTQAEMNDKAAQDFQKADKQLNKVYQQILNEYKDDIAFIENLKKAQRIWIQFRDAEMLAKFPDREKGYYGTVQPTCLSMYKTELTNARTKQLQIWINGIEEGDVCAGSVKNKE